MKLKKFDFNTIENFDSHILKSIPNYDVLLKMVLSLSEYFLEKGANIYDLGCSTGKLLKLLPEGYKKIGYDNAKIMPKSKEIDFINVDLNKPFEIENAAIVYSIFSLQFLNRNARGAYINTIYEGLNKGGALILCEKIYQESGFLQEILTFSHYDYKLQFFKEGEMLSKERDLRFIMKPGTFEDNIKLLEAAGFSRITTFWQSFNFIGIIAVK